MAGASGFRTLRRAILVAFVGATLLVLAPMVAVIAQPKLSSLASALLGFRSSDRYAKANGKGGARRAHRSRRDRCRDTVRDDMGARGMVKSKV
jgi:hypothetical protein